MKTKLFLLIYFLILSSLKAQIISTIAGVGSPGYSGDGSQATVAEVGIPIGIAFDAEGNLYITDSNSNYIRKINTSGIISTVVGTGTVLYIGDGGQATDAGINEPNDVEFDSKGNLYIADLANAAIRKVNTLGIITTVAGASPSGILGDGGQATDANLDQPSGIAFDKDDNLYISDNGHHCIRKVNSLGIISTVVGTGTYGNSGDGGQATDAEIGNPFGIRFDLMGNLYIADGGTANNNIRKVNTSGIITTVAGIGTYGYNGDGGQATDAELAYPYDIILDAIGNLYIADLFNERIRKVNTAGIITTITGNGTQAWFGDGGMATAAEINNPAGFAFDAAGDLYFSDGSYLIRKITNVAVEDIEQHLSNDNKTLVYPNPSSGNINITTTNNIDEIKITDIIGQIIYEAKPNTTNTTLQIDNAGIYFITLTIGKEISTKKVVINK